MPIAYNGDVMLESLDNISGEDGLPSDCLGVPVHAVFIHQDCKMCTWR